MPKVSHSTRKCNRCRTAFRASEMTQIIYLRKPRWLCGPCLERPRGERKKRYVRKDFYKCERCLKEVPASEVRYIGYATASGIRHRHRCADCYMDYKPRLTVNMLEKEGEEKFYPQPDCYDLEELERRYAERVQFAVEMAAYQGLA